MPLSGETNAGQDLQTPAEAESVSAAGPVDLEDEPMEVDNWPASHASEAGEVDAPRNAENNNRDANDPVT